MRPACKHKRVVLTLVSTLVASRATAEDETTRDPHRPPMPEPILAETTTDIDSIEPGELEFEVNMMAMRSRRGGASSLELSPELEWLPYRRFGLRVEPFFDRQRDAGSSLTQDHAGVSGGVAWKLLQDFPHDFHLQAQVDARVPSELDATVQPGESPLPVSIDLRSGVRRGSWTLRNSLGVSLGGDAAHVPLRASAAILTPFESSGRSGFFGVEVEADGARVHPVVLSFEAKPSLIPLGLPFSVALALPFSIGAEAREPSYGFFVRLLFESERETADGHGGGT